MLKKNASLFEGLFLASDLLVVTIAWIFSYWLRFQSGFMEIDKGIPPFSDYSKMLIFVWAVWAIVFRRAGLYKPMRGVRRVIEVFKLVEANLYAVVVLLALTYLFREKSIPFSRAVFLIFAITATFTTVAMRSVIRTLLRTMRRRGFNMRYSMVVGAGDLARKVATRYIEHPEYGVEVIGYLSAAGERTVGTQTALPLRATGGNAVAKYDYLNEPNQEIGPGIVGCYEDLAKYLDAGLVDQVIVALPRADQAKLKDVMDIIGDSVVEVKIVPDFHEFIQLGALVEEIDGLPAMSVASTPLSGINIITKRLFDFIFGSVFLIISSPVLILIATLVKLTSKGPIFFSQERVGLDGKCFKILKFRTMRIDAEKDGAKWAVKNDNRTTSIGAFLRKFSLDELPQLINVVTGKMSLVGPRPERPVFITDFRQRVPRYMLRHKVQAGMTGWAQINGWRGNTSIERRIEHDLYYVENWSLLLDVKIIFLTVFKGFYHKNAY